MSNTPSQELKACKTPIADLRKSDLDHYLEATQALPNLEWHSSIRDAINEYWDKREAKDSRPTPVSVEGLQRWGSAKDNLAKALEAFEEEHESDPKKVMVLVVRYAMALASAGIVIDSLTPRHDTPEPSGEDLHKNIVGSLRSQINAHGNITSNEIGSATKRIIGNLKNVSPPKTSCVGEDFDFGLQELTCANPNCHEQGACVGSSKTKEEWHVRINGKIDGLIDIVSKQQNMAIKALEEVKKEALNRQNQALINSDSAQKRNDTYLSNHYMGEREALRNMRFFIDSKITQIKERSDAESHN